MRRFTCKILNKKIAATVREKGPKEYGKKNKEKERRKINEEIKKEDVNVKKKEAQ